MVQALRRDGRTRRSAHTVTSIRWREPCGDITTKSRFARSNIDPKKIINKPKKIPNGQNPKNHGQTNINLYVPVCRGRPMCLPAQFRGGWVFCDRWRKPRVKTGGHMGPPLRRVSIRRQKPNQRDHHKIKIRTVQCRSKKL